MKAVLSRVPGGPETLSFEEVPDPEPGVGQIRISVRAVGVNYPDVLIIQDQYQLKPQRPFSPGAEASGVVDAIGPGVTGFSIGDRVVALSGWGAMAEKSVVPADRCLRIPDAMPFEDAAAFFLIYGTAHHAFRDRADLKAGETLLVLGAAGGVGSAAVRLGVAMGARVIAAASSPEKVAAAKRFGAHDGVVYTRTAMNDNARKALTTAFKNACGAADVIFDPIGGDYAEAALRSIAWKGRYLVIGFTAGIPKLPLNLILLKGCDIRGVYWGQFMERERERFDADVRELFELYRLRKIHVDISQRFTLARAGDAIALLGKRQVEGKIVVTV